MSAPARSIAPSRPTLVEARLPVIPASPQARKAALLLHGLSQADREWMLARVSAPERATLESLLAELGTLGIPADRELVEEVIGAAAEARPVAASAGQERGASGDGHGSAAPAARLAHAEPRALAAVLRDEPAGLVARLLELGEWPWRSALLEALGPRRREIEGEIARSRARSSHAGSNGAEAQALRQHLVAAVSSRLERASEHAPASPVRTPRFRFRPHRSAEAPAASWFSRLLKRRARG